MAISKAEAKKRIGEIDKKIRDNIKEYGFSVMSVFPGDDTPSFAYTIGLSESAGHPEICMVGFDPQMMQVLLRDAGALVINKEETFLDGTFSENIIQNYKVATKQPPPVKNMVNIFTRATVYYDVVPFKMVQMFLPDAKGLFPWDEGCDEQIAKVQQSLFVSEAEKLAPKLH